MGYDGEEWVDDLGMKSLDACGKGKEEGRPRSDTIKKLIYDTEL